MNTLSKLGGMVFFQTFESDPIPIKFDFAKPKSRLHILRTTDMVIESFYHFSKHFCFKLYTNIVKINKPNSKPNLILKRCGKARRPNRLPNYPMCLQFIKRSLLLFLLLTLNIFHTFFLVFLLLTLNK